MSAHRRIKCFDENPFLLLATPKYCGFAARIKDAQLQPAAAGLRVPHRSLPGGFQAAAPQDAAAGRTSRSHAGILGIGRGASPGGGVGRAAGCGGESRLCCRANLVSPLPVSLPKHPPQPCWKSLGRMRGHRPARAPRGLPAVPPSVHSHRRRDTPRLGTKAGDGRTPTPAKQRFSPGAFRGRRGNTCPHVEPRQARG